MTPADLAQELRQIGAGAKSRFLLGLAGAPGSGKSTLAAALADQLDDAQVLPMDGFHLDDRVLMARGDLARKGAPHTFDVGGFVQILRRARVEPHIYAPAFDRDLEIARAGAIEITPATRILIIEGNYLLHQDGGWADVRPELDLCWYLDVAEDVLQQRLTDRWTGYDMSPSEIAAKLDGNDLPNARIVAATAARADRRLDAIPIQST